MKQLSLKNLSGSSSQPFMWYISHVSKDTVNFIQRGLAKRSKRNVAFVDNRGHEIKKALPISNIFHGIHTLQQSYLLCIGGNISVNML